MKIVITGAWKHTDEERAVIESLGHEVVLMPDERGKLPCPPEEIEGVICNGLFLFHSIDDFKNLRYIQLTSAGYDRVPMDEIAKRGIKIFNARGVYSIPMAEFALCGVLQLYKQSNFFAANQRNSVWEKHRNILEIYGKNVLVVGCGSVGDECAKRFAALGTSVRGVDLYPREDTLYERISPLESLGDEFSLADIIVLTLPLTEKTNHLIDGAMLSRAKNNSILVNIARGAIVDTAALIKSLDSQRIGGAVLDVFEEEPLNVNSPLWKMNNVIITPHNSFVGDGNGERLCRVIKSNLENLQ